MQNKGALLLTTALLSCTTLWAQNTDESADKVVLSGSVQVDALAPTGKQSDGSNEDFRLNSYVDLNASSKYVDAGVRFEYLEHPLPGFESDFKDGVSPSSM